MESIHIILTLATLANVMCVFIGYHFKNYKIAIFNAFVSGVCLMALLNSI